MENGAERNWTAHVVLSSEHAGLAHEFKQLERELYRVLAHVDDPRQVREYLRAMKNRSEEWIARHRHLLGEK